MIYLQLWWNEMRRARSKSAQPYIPEMVQLSSRIETFTIKKIKKINPALYAAARYRGGRTDELRSILRRQHPSSAVDRLRCYYRLKIPFSFCPIWFRSHPSRALRGQVPGRRWSAEAQGRWAPPMWPDMDCHLRKPQLNFKAFNARLCSEWLGAWMLNGGFFHSEKGRSDSPKPFIFVVGV